MFRCCSVIARVAPRTSAIVSRNNHRLFQNRKNTTSKDKEKPQKFDALQQTLQKFIDAPEGSVGNWVFKTLVDSGTLKIQPANAPEEGLFLKMMYASQWDVEYAKKIAVHDKQRVGYTISLEVPDNISNPMTRHDIASIPKMTNYLKDSYYDALNFDSLGDVHEHIQGSFRQGEQRDLLVNPLYVKLLIDEGGSGPIVDSLCQYSNMDYGNIMTKANYPVTVNVNRDFNSFPLTAVYDRAIMTRSLYSDNEAKVSRVKCLLAFSVDSKEDTEPSLSGPMVAQMLVQAVYNYVTITSFHGAEAARDYKTRLIVPKEVKDGDVYYSMAICFAGHKMSIYRAEIPLKFLDHMLHEREVQPIPPKKFVIRQVASPSGNGFDLLKINDLHALFDFFASFSLNCNLQLIGYENRPSMFTTGVVPKASTKDDAEENNGSQE